MPRLPPRLLRQAYSINPTLLPLLPVCRDIRSAQLELKWLSEYAAKISRNSPLINIDRLIKSYVTRRSRGEPLQLILGSEYFGDLELKCQPEVLIPRSVLFLRVSYGRHLIFLSLDKRLQSQSPISCIISCPMFILFHPTSGCSIFAQDQAAFRFFSTTSSIQD